MQDLIKFEYNSLPFNAMSINGEPWFLAKEVCNILELSNVGEATSRLDEDEKNTVILNDGIGNPNKTIISESGFYSLILSSRKSEAKPFKKWVTNEVLPAIRKTGSYSVKSPAELTRMDILQMALEAEHKVLILEEQNQLQAKELKDAQPHVNYSKNVLQSDNGIRITIIAKELGMSAEKLNDLLHQKRVQYKQNGTWVLYDKYQDKGYTKTLTVHFTTSTGAGTNHLTVWTETGRMFIHQLVNEKIKTA